jgi:hypothetical protein
MGALVSGAVDTGEPASPAEDETAPFKDVDKASWAYGYIMDLYARGIVSGNGDGNFGPDNDVTREEFLKMLLTALKLPAARAEGAAFADVAEDAWYAGHVYSGHAYGVCKGVSDDLFGVGRAILRQDMAVMVKRALDYAGVALPQNGAPAVRDMDAVSEYAAPSVAALVEAGVVTGSENAAFNPNDNLSRAQAAKILSLISNLHSDSEGGVTE